MTNSIRFPTPFEEPILNAGVLLEWEGMILQRGSEELALEKLSDRFTLCPVVDPVVALQAGIYNSLNNLAQQFQSQFTELSVSTGLIEFRVDASRLESAMQAARASDGVAFVSHVYQMKQSPGTPLYLTDQVTIQFVESVGVEQIRAIAVRFGLRVIKLVPGVSKTFVFQVTANAPANPIKLANRLMRHSEVLLAEPNVAVQVQQFHSLAEDSVSEDSTGEDAAQASVESTRPYGWHLYHDGDENNGHENGAANSHISIKAAWEIVRGVRSIAVAIVDQEIDLNHPSFQGEGKIVEPFGELGEWRNSGREAETAEQSDSGDRSALTHGTISARLAVAEEPVMTAENDAAKNNAEVVEAAIGVAPGCALMPIGVSQFLDDQSVEQLFEWAMERGAAVVACGWGAAAVYFPLSLRQRVAIARAATQGRAGKGCVVLFAAGNANRPVDGLVNEQGGAGSLLQGEMHWLNGFAVHPDVIAVAASTQWNQKAAYSNWGDGISIAAPSGNQAPGVVLPQIGLIQTTPIVSEDLLRRENGSDRESDRESDRDPVEADEHSDSSESTPDASSEILNGTSGACAIAAGVAALVLSVNPELTAREVKQLLQDTADKIVDTQPDIQLGFCQGTYSAQGHSQGFGYGKVNAFRAVQAAQQRLVTCLPSRWVEQRNSNPIDIPDYYPEGVTSTIQISSDRPVWDIEVTVQIEHSFISDLEIYLISPGGDAVLLQNRTSGRLSMLSKTYSLQNTPLLQAVLGKPAQGQWQLKLIDQALLNTGQLKSWQIRLGI